MSGEEFETESRVVDPSRQHGEEGSKVRANIWLRKEMWDSVNDIAKEEDISASSVVRDALKDYIRKHKSSARRR